MFKTYLLLTPPVILFGLAAWAESPVREAVPDAPATAQAPAVIMERTSEEKTAESVEKENTEKAGEDTAEAEAEPKFEMAEADLEAAAKIFQKSCRACHGNKAQGAASYPKLSDKEPEYIAEMLERYRSGEKIGPNSILMIQHAKKLSDEDIANISVYVATVFD